MKAKNVKSVLRNKFKHFLEHVRSEEVRDVLANNTIITGGAIASMLRGEEVSDFDLYFRTKEAARIVAEHYCGEFAGNLPPRFRSGEPVDITVQELADRIKIVVKSAGAAAETPAGESAGE